LPERGSVSVSDDGKGTIVGWRDDKNPEEVVLEV
jgi:hypothetical protein